MHVNLPRTRTESTAQASQGTKPSTADKTSSGNFGDLLKSAKASAAAPTGANAAATAPQAASATAAAAAATPAAARPTTSLNAVA
jgi:hypothetical protein